MPSPRERIVAEAEAEAEALRISRAAERAEVVRSGLIEWVGKTDGRTAFLFAINTALGGVALGTLSLSTWSIFEVVLYSAYFTLFSVVSFHLVMVQYPNVTSPNRSLLFFGTIAAQPFDDFVEKFSSMTDEDYLKDVLHQCHVNALVVSKKFQRLQRAMRLLILSSILWVPAVAVPAVTTPSAKAFFQQIFAPSGPPDVPPPGAGIPALQSR